MAEDEANNPFPPFAFMRQDESADPLFYQVPRLVVHIDDQAIAAIGRLFQELFPVTHQPSPGAPGVGSHWRVLDLMSSWRSHWPRGPAPEGLETHQERRDGKSMVGLGLNAVEMRGNPDLDRHVVHDVNTDPRLPFEDSSFDGAVISVSVQYLTRPVEVFRDVNRVLVPGGSFVVIFSNRMFFTKAVRIWVEGNDQERMDLVGTYFQQAGNYEDIRGICRNPDRGPYDDPLYVVMARKAA